MWLWPPEQRREAIEELATLLPRMTADDLERISDRQRQIWYGSITRSHDEEFAEVSLSTFERMPDPRAIAPLNHICRVFPNLRERAKNLIDQISSANLQTGEKQRLLRSVSIPAGEHLLKPAAGSNDSQQDALLRATSEDGSGTRE